MSAKSEKVLLPSPPRTQTVVGYAAIYRTGDFGGRKIDTEILYENRLDCELDCQNDDNFVAVATVTWEEPA